MIKLKLFSVVFVFLCGLQILSAQTNFYLRQHRVDNNFSNAGNWVTNPADVNTPGTPASIAPHSPNLPTHNVFFTEGLTSSVVLITTQANPIVVGNITVTTPTNVVITLPNRAFDVYGSISAPNGNLRTTGTPAINMLGSINAEINLGTTANINFGALNINKTAGARVDLRHDLNLTGRFTLIAGNFITNGHDIRVPTIEFRTPVGDNWLGTTLYLTANATSNFVDGSQGVYNFDIISSNSTFAFSFAPTTILLETTFEFRSLTFNNTTGTNVQIGNTYLRPHLIIGDLTINTPHLIFRGENLFRNSFFPSINVRNTMTLQRGSNIVLNSEIPFVQEPTHFTVNQLVLPAENVQRSSLTGLSPVNFNVASPMTVSNMMFQNINFTGAAVTFSEAYDGGANSGNFTLAPASVAQNFHWVGTGNTLTATGSQWTNLANWRIGSPAGTTATRLPGARDNVFFPNRTTAYMVVLDVSAVVNNITWEDTNRRGTLANPSTTHITSLSIRGNADFFGASQINPNLFFTGRAGGNFTVRSGNESVYGGQVFFRHQGSYTLTSDFLMRISNNSFFDHSAGVLNSGGFNIEVGRFASYYAFPAGATRSLMIAGSEIRSAWARNEANHSKRPYTIYINRTGMDNYDFASSNFIVVNTGTDTSANNSRRFRINGQFHFYNISFRSPYGPTHLLFDNPNNTINTLSYTGPGAMGSFGFTVNTLILTPNKTYTLPSFAGTTAQDMANRTVTIASDLISNTSNCIGLVLQGVSSTGIIQNNTGRQISIGASSVRNINWISPTPLLVPGGVSLGGTNTNVSITPPISTTMYWVGGTGNWSDPANWSLTSGVWYNPGNCIPGRLDRIYFDGGSFTASGQTVTLNVATIDIVNMTWTDEAGTRTPSFVTPAGTTINISGSMRLASGMVWTQGGTVNFTGTNTGTNSHIIDGNNVIIGSSLNFNGSGRFDLRSNLQSAFNITINASVGSFFSNGFDMTVPLGFVASTTDGIAIHQSAGRIRDISNSVLSARRRITLNVNDCVNFITAGTSLVTTSRDASTPDLYVNIVINSTGACSVSFRSISSTRRMETNTRVFAERITIGTTDNFVKHITTTGVGTFVTDTLQFFSNLRLAAGTTVTVNHELMSMTGTPCDQRSLSGASAANRGNLIFTYCNPTIANILLSNINVSVLPEVDCDNPQELLVFGINAGGNIGPIRFSDELQPGGILTLPKLYVACASHLLRMAQGYIVSYQWRRSTDGGNTFVNITAANGGTARNLLVTESAIYRLNADFGAGCLVSFQLEVEFTGHYRTWLGLNNNWNDHNNWFPPSVPDECSHVIIPGGLTFFPIITVEDEAVCEVVIFHFGGEIQNTHLLTYERAEVEMALNSNQWYMISAPLRNMHSGDFFINVSNPFQDLDGRGLLVHTQLFNVRNPQTQFLEASWTGAFNSSCVELLPGKGMALFANPRFSNFNQQNQMTCRDCNEPNRSFWFPKTDNFHNYFDRNGNWAFRGAYLDRIHSGRFIYESVINGTNVSLTHSPLVSGQYILIGNPFMAQLDFMAFAAANSELIYPQYQLALGVNTAVPGTKNNLGMFSIVGGNPVSTNPALTRYIAPMQSFIVRARTNGGQLVANISDHTATRTVDAAANNALQNTLRSDRNQTDKSMLHITASRGTQHNTAVLVYWIGGDRNFRPLTDSRKIFGEHSQAAVSVFLLSGDGYALGINTTNDLTNIVPIGIRTSVRGNITLSFSGMESFGNTTIFLHDSRTGQVVNLSQTNTFTFNKDEEELFVNNRLYLRFENNTITTNTNNTDNGQVVVFSSSLGILSIVSSGGENLGSIEILDIKGRAVIRESNIQTAMYNTHIAQGVYFVRVLGETKKIIIQ